MNKLIFRIDDISLNTDINRLHTDIITPIQRYCRNVLKAPPYFLMGVSPAVFEMPWDQGPTVSERIFPAILNAHSNHDVFYRPQKIGIPDLKAISKGMEAGYKFCAHGMFHIDHRLITKEAQEINILSSLSLVEAACELHETNYGRIFIPPFNKINDETEAIAKEHRVHIIKWSTESWRHLKYTNESQPVRITDILTPLAHTYNPTTGIYLHTHDFPNRDSVEKQLKHVTR